MSSSNVALFQGSRISESGLALRRALGIPKWKGSIAQAKTKQFLINWGVTYFPNRAANIRWIINNPEWVKISANKFLFFHSLRRTTVSHPRYFQSWAAVEDTFIREKRHFVARQVLNGHSGEGIVYCGDNPARVAAPLYVEYIKKAAESRVHFIRERNEGFRYFVQRKARKVDVENPDWKVRNLAGGFIYANDPANVGEIPEDVMTQARMVAGVCNLSFGAIDIIWNKRQKKAYVLELNTAPGLEGRTLEFYTTGLKDLLLACGATFATPRSLT